MEVVRVPLSHQNIHSPWMGRVKHLNTTPSSVTPTMLLTIRLDQQPDLNWISAVVSIADVDSSRVLDDSWTVRISL